MAYSIASGFSIGYRLWSSPSLNYGPQLVKNGNFSSATGHTLAGADISITGGQLVVVAGAATKTDSQTVTLIPGKTYRFTVTVLARTAGNVTPTLVGGTAVTGTAISTTGAFSQDLVALTGNVTIRLFFNAAAAMSIDNWSVRQVG